MGLSLTGPWFQKDCLEEWTLLRILIGRSEFFRDLIGGNQIRSRILIGGDDPQVRARSRGLKSQLQAPSLVTT